MTRTLRVSAKVSLVEKELLKQTPRGIPSFVFASALVFGSPLSQEQTE